MDNFEQLSLAFLERQPQAAANQLQQLAPEHTARFLAQVPTSLLTPVLAAMASWPAARILAEIPPQQAGEVLHELPPARAETLLRLMSETQRDSVLDYMPDFTAKTFRLKLTYPLTTIGAWMDSSMPCFAPDSTVGDCLDRVKRHHSHLGGILMVVDDMRHLIGVVSVDTLLTSDSRRPLTELISADLTPLSARATLWEVRNHSGWTRFPTLPVTGPNQVLLGALPFTALMEGTRKIRQQPASNPRLSLVIHLCRVFFVVVGGLLKALWGITDNNHRPTGSVTPLARNATSADQARHD